MPPSHNPISEWIVSVGEHPGIISSNRWIRVQESLERNKSKSYHKSRGNEALLTGLLWCSCGSRMYPKVTGRKTADGAGGLSLYVQTEGAQPERVM